MSAISKPPSWKHPSPAAFELSMTDSLVQPRSMPPKPQRSSVRLSPKRCVVYRSVTSWQALHMHDDPDGYSLCGITRTNAVKSDAAIFTTDGTVWFPPKVVTLTLDPHYCITVVGRTRSCCVLAYQACRTASYSAAEIPWTKSSSSSKECGDDNGIVWYRSLRVFWMSSRIKHFLS